MLQSLVKKPLASRRSILRDQFIEVEGQFSFARSMDSTETEAIQLFLEDAVKSAQMFSWIYLATNFLFNR